MIRHIVLLEFPADYDRAELADIVKCTKDLQRKMAGFSRFGHGENRNFEGMSDQYSYVLICDLDNEDALRAFLLHPEHTELGERLVKICLNGVDGITTVDVAMNA